MLKYEFSVITRDGQAVDSILIAGKDQADAERKLLQMYYHCSITRCLEKQDDGKRSTATSLEDILSLISNMK
jgi:hypothetical protein